VIPAFVYDLVVRLRRRGLPIGVDDCVTLRSALAAGFGLDSSDDLRDLCVALWATSPAEREMIVAAFATEAPGWSTAIAPPAAAGSPAPAMADPTGFPAAASPTPVAPPPQPVVRPFPGVPGPPPATGEWDPALVVAPQQPLTAREIAQVWRRLRRPMRHGPSSELDIEATVDRYARTAVASGPVLRPPRRNTARLLLLVDRQGSMTPYHGLTDHLLREIRNAGRLDAITVAYFRNLPGRVEAHGLLDTLSDPFAPEIDPILAEIPPLTSGRLYRDPALTEPAPLPSMLEATVPGAAVAVISDGGATRGTFVTGRLVSTVALVKALHRAGGTVAWLNPAPPSRWPGSTAAQIERHVAMFPLTVAGMYRAVDVLRGRPRRLERPA
jgi:uncharacterized protein